MKKTETVVRKDNSIYGVYDFIDSLQLRLDIIEGKITEPLYFRDEHGGVSEMSKINEYGSCNYYNHFPIVDELLFKIIQAQMNKKLIE